MDDMGRGSPSSHRYRNEGESTFGSSQARRSSVPTAYESFQIGSGGGMASTFPSNINAFAGHTQTSQAYTQSHLAAGNVPPGFWEARFQRGRLQSPAENTEGSLPSHPHGSPIPGTDIVGNNTPSVGYSPPPQLGQSYPGVVVNGPIGIMNPTNVRPNAFQLAGVPYGVQWRAYGAVPSLYQPLNHPNQSTGGFLSAGQLGSNAVPGTWVDYRSRNMSGLSYQTIVRQPDASFTGVFQYHNHNSTGVDPLGQFSEQTAQSDLDSIQRAAVRGDYEFNYWITHGHPPSPSHTISALRNPSGSISGPPSQGPSTGQGVAMANDLSVPMPKPLSSLQGSISNRQTGNVMVSSSNEAAGAPTIQNRSGMSWMHDFFVSL